jgi:hypothetical protein
LQHYRQNSAAPIIMVGMPMIILIILLLPPTCRR